MGRQTFERNVNAQASQGRNGSQAEMLEQMIMPQVDNSRMVFLHGDVTENAISNIIVQMLGLANVSQAPIYLVVSTYGGSLDEMFSLYDTIKFLPCPVHTVALGKVMSAGVLLLASGAKGKRLIGASARIMMHPLSAGVYGNIFEIENETAEAKRLQQLMVDALTHETKMTRAQVQKIMKSGLDCYVTPEDAVKFGIVDKIIGTG